MAGPESSLLRYLARKAVSRAAGPLPSRDWRPSAITSVEDDPATQGFPAMAMVLDALGQAATLRIDTASASEEEAAYFNAFPGDHYRLIAALVRCLQPSLLVEIGTYTGMATRVMCDHAPAACHVVTYDLLPWDRFRSHLNAADFGSGRLEQHLVDLADPAVFAAQLGLLQEADLIFCDAPKDGAFEPRFLNLLAAGLEPVSRPRFLLLDDIRLLPMVGLWRSIASPKLDLTSFGHWSGTGLVDVREGLRLDAAAA
jgi:predicted O-methyltransferase YrrM